jgi:hypothetical protein
MTGMGPAGATAVDELAPWRSEFPMIDETTALF